MPNNSQKAIVRSDSSSNWLARNEVLPLGELAFELDTNRLKVGDGVHNWHNLKYIHAFGPTGDSGQDGVTGPKGDVYSTHAINFTSRIPQINEEVTIPIPYDTAYSIGQKVFVAANHWNYFSAYIKTIVNLTGAKHLYLRCYRRTINGYDYSDAIGEEFDNWTINLDSIQALGITGPTGAKGDDGPAGADSTVAGPTGVTGSVGPQGQLGETGPAGPVGPIGLTGPQGAVGPDGPQGPAGQDSNVVGPVGPVGPDGPDGPQGAVGPVGPVGPDGASWSSGTADPSGGDDGDFYFETDTDKIWKKTSGTWAVIATVTGDVGPAGPAGPVGPVGPSGGPVGPTGATGATGVSQGGGMFSFKFENSEGSNDDDEPNSTSFDGKIRKSTIYVYDANNYTCEGAYNELTSGSTNADTYIYLSKFDKDGHDLQNIFEKGYSGANTEQWFDAWLKIQRGDKFIIFDVSAYKDMDTDTLGRWEKLEDSNNSTIGYKILIGKWDSNNTAWSTWPMVQNINFDTANANCNSNTSPVAANEILTVTYEFRESVGSFLPNELPDTSSGEKYFLKFNEGGQNNVPTWDITWEQDSGA